MNEDVLAQVIKQIVEATNNNEPDYTILASIILLVFLLFAALTKYMGTQIIKQQEASANRRERLLNKIDTDVIGHTTKLENHEVRIDTAEKNITKLWENKIDKPPLISIRIACCP